MAADGDRSLRGPRHSSATTRRQLFIRLTRPFLTSPFPRSPSLSLAVSTVSLCSSSSCLRLRRPFPVRFSASEILRSISSLDRRLNRAVFTFHLVEAVLYKEEEEEEEEEEGAAVQRDLVGVRASVRVRACVCVRVTVCGAGRMDGEGDAGVSEAWMAVVLGVFVCVVTLHTYLAKKSEGDMKIGRILAATAPSALDGPRKFLIVTAHPDDECMFFAPTIQVARTAPVTRQCRRRHSSPGRACADAELERPRDGLPAVPEHWERGRPRGGPRCRAPGERRTARRRQPRRHGRRRPVRWRARGTGRCNGVALILAAYFHARSQHRLLRDGMQEQWPAETAARYVRDCVDRWKIDMVSGRGRRWLRSARERTRSA